MNKKFVQVNFVFVFVFACCFCNRAYADVLSPLGFSGQGIIPSAQTIGEGRSSLAFDPTVPGAPVVTGYNYLLGFGLSDQLELVGRLATNDLKCNQFVANACPIGTIRDLSASVKWQASHKWLRQNDVNVSIGATDLGGAASWFKSYYAVASKKFGQYEVSLGNAKAKASGAMLDGSFAAVTLSPTEWSKISVQRVTNNTLASLYLATPFWDDKLTGWVTINQQLTGSTQTSKNWAGVGVSMPVTGAPISAKQIYSQANTQKTHEIKRFSSQELPARLKQNGFYKYKIGKTETGKIVLKIDASSYSWNILDATGVALALISGAYANDTNDIFYELVLSVKGVDQVQVNGEVNCTLRWLDSGRPCNELSIKSALERFNVSDAASKDIVWSESTPWSFRPEVTLVPRIISSLGTEYGAFDADVGVDINTVIPLWEGATYDHNRVRSLGVNTQNFESGGLFYYSRISPLTTRSLLHQVVALPRINSQVRLSWGTANTFWQGTQVESSTQSDNGRHRFGMVTGNFKNESLAYNNERGYQLAKYRYAATSDLNTTTEVVSGKFWGQDKGYSVTQKFWHGDTALSVYFRRTRVSAATPLYSFAGFEISLPLTPRKNAGFEHLMLKGPSQWSYALETRVLARENTIVGGFGVVPKVGESLAQTLNQDRNSTKYYDMNLFRVREAAASLILDQ
jgi:hypothetical protein